MLKERYFQTLKRNSLTSALTVSLKRPSFSRQLAAKHMYWLGLVAWRLAISAASKPSLSNVSTRLMTDLQTHRNTFLLIHCYDTYLHVNGLFNIYQLYLTLEEISSKLSRAYALLFWRRWSGTHFGRPRFIGARIWSGVTCFQWQSVGVRLNRHPRVSGGRPPGSNPLWKG